MKNISITMRLEFIRFFNPIELDEGKFVSPVISKYNPWFDELNIMAYYSKL